MTKEKSEDYFRSVLAVEHGILSGNYPSDFQDMRTRKPFVAANTPRTYWNAVEVAKFPEPEMYDSYDEFEASAARWLRCVRESVDSTVLPYTPKELSEHGVLETVKSREIYEPRQNPIEEQPPKNLTLKFTREDLLLEIMKIEKPAPCDDCVMIDIMNSDGWVDGPYGKPGNRVDIGEKPVPFAEVRFLSVADLESLPLTERQKIVMSVVDCIASNGVTHLWGIFNDLREFEYLLRMCSDFVKGSLCLITPEFEVVSKVESESISHAHRIFLLYYYFRKLREFLEVHKFTAAVEILESYISSACEQITLYFQVFETDLVTWAMTQMNQETVGLMVCILQIMYRYQIDLVERILSITETDESSVLNLISMYSPGHFGRLRYDIFGMKRITLLYYNHFNNLRPNKDFTPLMVRFVGDLFSIEVSSGVVHSGSAIDSSWAVGLVTQISQIIIEDKKSEFAYVLLQICRLLKRGLKGRVLDSKTIKDSFPRIVSCLVSMLVNPEENETVIASALMSIAALASAKNTLQALIKSREIETVLQAGVTESVEVSNAFWKVIRTFFARNTKLIPALLENPMWKEQLSKIFVTCRTDQTFGIFKTLEKLIRMLVPPDSSVQDEVMNVGLIFMLTAVPDEIVAFLQLMCDNEFKPYPTALSFMKMNSHHKEQAQVYEFLQILSERKSCWQLVKKTGRKGRQLCGVSKPKFQRVRKPGP